MASNPDQDEQLQPEPPATPVAGWEWLLLALAMLLAAGLRLSYPEAAYFNIHTERDLYRALQLITGDEFPLLGSEMQYGGRVFGPFVYFLYAIPLFFTKSALFLGVFVGAFNLVVIGATWWFARRHFGVVVALAAVWLYAAFPLDVVRLRYLWNPSFFVGMVLGLYASLHAWTIGRKPWAVVPLVLFASLAFQLHFSVVMAIPAVAVLVALRRPVVALKPVLAAAGVVFVLFLPALIHELKPGRANIKEVIATPEARPSFLERHRFNPNAWRNLLHVVSPDWDERGERMGFTYLAVLNNRVAEAFGEKAVVVLRSAEALGRIQLFLWFVGLAYLARRLWEGLRARRNSDAGREAGTALLLLCWQFSPLLFLSFFNYHRNFGGSDFSIVPLRYYLITWPAQFFIAGIGFATLWSLARLPAWRAGMVALLAVAVACGSALGAGYIALLKRTGRTLDYTAFRVPSLETMLEVREVLLGPLAMTADDYYRRLSTQNVFQPMQGEATMDFLVVQDPRSQSNTGLPAGRTVIVWSPINLQALPPGAGVPGTVTPQLPGSVVEEHRVRDLRIFVLEGAPPPEKNSTFDPNMKRNWYYREDERVDNRMKFLGGG